ncbi:DNA polymerase III subunit gamma/tau [Patescibacteria group bacterium]|nr:DNA polymerase III subunit gamma/tau [Patescibacteria group bacterium]MBU3999669.1 DNA polymerase III subunit gamma/tau [Patescibacteria group bacterium]MBU4057158.1 DNA polymerase III subunit gamma/tau [Patescibacteria group bacterium]MBU4368351.1 DNA polymerase III subunit gamma/tau [Patescibacteria group bacterium]
MFLALYRKYRPKNFREVIGQEKIIKILSAAIETKRTAHAYLFSGPRGIGKTTVARILAKALNCENVKNGEPCNKCAACKTVNEGKSFDIVEIDAASNTGVDNIRDLKATVGFSPSILRYKVFIIDEAHMLSKGAFNALLKTMEEPPAHAVFILATTEIHKIPATIISRAQRFDFQKLGLAEMINRLKLISEEENIKIGKGVLELIAISAEGGMRDAESMLGQIISLEIPGKEISLEEVRMILGITDFESVLKFIGYLSENKVREAIIFINEICFAGQDMEQFAAALTYNLRKIIILKINPDLKNKIADDSTEEQFKKLLHFSKIFSEAKLLWLIKKTINVKNEIKTAALEQIPFEIAAIEYRAFSGRGAETGADKNSPKIDFKKNLSERLNTEVANKVEKAASFKKTESEKEQKSGLPGPTIENLKSEWDNIIKLVKKYNHSISAFLKSSSPLKIDSKNVTIATPYKFHEEKLNEPANRRIIEKALAEALNIPQNLEVKIIQDEKMASAPKPIKKQDPEIESALEIFGGEVVE